MKTHIGEELFQKRLIREGRATTFNQILNDYISSGEHLAVARVSAMKEMGYAGQKIEKALAAQWEDSLENEANADLCGVEEACKLLPKSANPAAELDWVRIHPAIRRCAMEKDKTKQIVITADDVMNSQAGQAPSVGAVNMLMHAVNAPSKFFDKLLDEQKKRVDNEQGTNATRADLGIEEIRRYLGQLQNRSKGNQ